MKNILNSINKIVSSNRNFIFSILAFGIAMFYLFIGPYMEIPYYNFYRLGYAIGKTVFIIMLHLPFVFFITSFYLGVKVFKRKEIHSKIQKVILILMMVYSLSQIIAVILLSLGLVNLSYFNLG